MSKPGWMNGSLEEEWIEQDEAQDMSIAHDDDAERSPIQDQDEGVALTRSTRSSQDSGTSATAVSESEQQGGTFLVREDVLHEPVTPAKRLVGMKGKANPLTKSFFSPLALEKMFEPPSPPLQKSNGARVPSRLSESHVPERIPSRRGPGPSDSQANDQPRVDEIVDSDLPDVVRSVDFRPDTYHSFTFQTPIASPSPVSHSTPAEPPLRLFQTYDTYTKDHLYALANSIDVKSTVDSPSEDGYIRHSKRIKLSAPDDLIEGSSRSSPRARRSSVTPPSRPSSRRDYLGESRSLMQQIREHRSLSLATTVPSDAAPLSIVEEKDEEAQLSEGNISRSVSDHWKDENYVTSPARGASSQAYRLQAASLMAQIRSEVHEDMPNESLRFGMANLSLRDDSVRNVAVPGTMPQRHPTRSDDASPSAPRNRTASLGSASRPSRILVNGDIANTTPTIRLEPNSPTEPIPPQNQDDLILLSTPPQEAQPLVVDSLRPSDGTPSTFHPMFRLELNLRSNKMWHGLL
ncbi:uncharacterized protein EI90DRAFT_478932 [Cantharellus anzutake]|uniref:uncharacterized protein n=1 Tax=Cantharellus anzutake TaxID=1750568 RepID=UPI001907F4B2|nr:uncharacterized protein EI90DRAFT_478932 [Cantharellus anzutake]KAF8313958.1 hypothetical protein EI90DRAFT_478932 [Cantharellus anzutake]